MEIIFWSSFALVLYVYVGYPFALSILARICPGPRSDVAQFTYATVTVILPVHNEERIIADKLKNLTECEYPHNDIEFLVVSDASTDRTDDIARNFAERDERIQLTRLPFRQGKAAALNEGLDHSDGDIVVFTDASIMLKPLAIQNLAAAFGDAAVGCASGEDQIEGVSGESVYGRYELFLRRKESSLHSIVGASGCLYAQRRTLCTRFKAGAAPDFQSVLDTVDRGYRAVSVPSAVGIMKAGSRFGEFGRKVRTVLRGMTTLSQNLSLSNRLGNWRFVFSLVSHKLMRWLVPFFLTLLMAASISLAEYPFYLAATLLQTAFYSVGILSFALQGHMSITWKLPRIAEFFVISNIAILVASYKWMRGVTQEVWSPTQRTR